MGTNISQLERDIGTDFPANEHYFGLVNVSREAKKTTEFNKEFNILQFSPFYSLEILVTVIQYFKLYISANRSARKCWIIS